MTHSPVPAKPKRILKNSSATSGDGVIFLKSPSPKNGRATFAIVRRKRVKGKTVNETLKPEALIAINEQFTSKKITFEQARLLAQEVVHTLTPPKTAVLHNEANLKILNDYWADQYEERDIVDPASARNRLVRAVEAVGHYSLLSASKAELQKEIDSRFKGNKQRVIVSALNQILSWLKRGIKLKKNREEFARVRHITREELDQLLSHIQHPVLELFHRVAFGTGLRYGELFSILPEDVGAESIKLSYQYDRDGTQRATKNRRVRKAFILPEFHKDVVQLANLTIEERLQYRNFPISKVTQKAAKKIGKSCSFHDLRHSYAIYLISKGASLTLVSQSIGDSIKVTEQYYAGFVLTPESIQLLSSILKS
jgi:integrase